VSIPEDLAIYEMSVESLWMSTLKTLSAFQTYRRLKAVHVSSRDVVDFLVNEERFPRSIKYCLQEIESCLRDMPFSGIVLNKVQLSKSKLIQFQGDAIGSSKLHELIDETQKDLGEINSALASQYFHAPMNQSQAAS
jgi:uncharacterized alpha-E superfamily protein